MAILKARAARYKGSPPNHVLNKKKAHGTHMAILKARATPYKGSPPNLVPHVFVLAATARVSCFPFLTCNRPLAHRQDTA